MKVELRPGKYVLAVSGGVDSMALLHLLSSKIQDPRSRIQFVVAHFNHGIRANSDKDEELVEQTAKKMGLPFELGHGRLGKLASEAAARKARYGFLEKIRQKHKATAIITAHHQDDLIETALLNIMRGSGRRGLTAMQHNQKVVRPLLDTSKSEILKYAKKHQIKWREDSTNKDLRYRRNCLRIKVLPKLKTGQRAKFLTLIKGLESNNLAIDESLEALAAKIETKTGVNRLLFSLLPSEIANELTAYYLRRRGFPQFDKPTIERLSMAIKTAPAGSRHDVYGRLKLKLTKEVGQFELTD